MEKVSTKFLISSFNKIPYGISISLIRALPHLNKFGFIVNYDKLRNILKDFNMFHKTDNLEQYVYYVFKNIIEYAPTALSFDTGYDILRKNCKCSYEKLISLEEYIYMQSIYVKFVDTAINNFLNNKSIFPLDIVIDKEEIKNLYNDIKGDKRKVDKFIETFTNFFIYNGFVVYDLRTIFLTDKNTIKITFFELNSSGTTSYIIKNNDN